VHSTVKRRPHKSLTRQGHECHWFCVRVSPIYSCPMSILLSISIKQLMWSHSNDTHTLSQSATPPLWTFASLLHHVCSRFPQRNPWFYLPFLLRTHMWTNHLCYIPCRFNPVLKSSVPNSAPPPSTIPPTPLVSPYYLLLIVDVINKTQVPYQHMGCQNARSFHTRTPWRRPHSPR
jgi:hypothetical protein